MFRFRRLLFLLLLPPLPLGAGSGLVGGQHALHFCEVVAGMAVRSEEGVRPRGIGRRRFPGDLTRGGPTFRGRGRRQSHVAALVHVDSNSCVVRSRFPRVVRARNGGGIHAESPPPILDLPRPRERRHRSRASDGPGPGEPAPAQSHFEIGAEEEIELVVIDGAGGERVVPFLGGIHPVPLRRLDDGDPLRRGPVPHPGPRVYAHRGRNGASPSLPSAMFADLGVDVVARCGQGGHFRSRPRPPPPQVQSSPNVVMMDL